MSNSIRPSSFLSDTLTRCFCKEFEGDNSHRQPQLRIYSAPEKKPLVLITQNGSQDILVVDMSLLRHRYMTQASHLFVSYFTQLKIMLAIIYEQGFSVANNALSSQEHCETYLRVCHILLHDPLLV